MVLCNPEQQDDKYYEHFTIYTLNEPRKNVKATELFQMLKVNENPIDQRDIELDLKCFPTLYPFGSGGQYVSRPIKISASEFIKTKMMSINSIFRTNSQYLFFLLHESNIRALKAGIYHKLNVSNTKEKLTSSECLKRLESNELEGNLTIFARLRNTSQYWLTPRSDIEIMITWYGPVTFFLTLSPAEYNWERLDKYLRKVNSDVQHGKTTAALIALDPVSTSRIIENKFRAMLDFISSDDGPIGKVVHYAWRREYQTRGLQHFHIVIWVDQALLLGESTNEQVA